MFSFFLYFVLFPSIYMLLIYHIFAKAHQTYYNKYHTNWVAMFRKPNATLGTIMTNLVAMI